MKILHTSLHHILHEENTIDPVDISGANDELTEYVEKLIFDIGKNERKRSFEFTHKKTQVRASIDDMLSGDYEDSTYDNALRLLRVETDVVDRFSHLNGGVQKGSLFQAHVEHSNGQSIVICKADHNEFLDLKDFINRKGLPWKNKVFKAILIEINDKEVNNVFVFDTNNSIAKYWWFEFLELSPLYSDKYNTNNCLDKILKKVINPLKEKYPRDYYILRNSTVGYFKSKEEFDITEYSKFINDYNPTDEDLPKDKMTSSINSLPKKWKFDNRFTISKTDINKRLLTNVVKLTNDIELQLKGYLKEEDDIISYGEDDGEKYIKIKTEKGYQYFKKEGFQDDKSN
jgi:hypothetical protein